MEIQLPKFYFEKYKLINNMQPKISFVSEDKQDADKASLDTISYYGMKFSDQITKENVKFCKHSLVQIYSFHQLVKSYFAFPSSLFTMHLIVSLIISLFYCVVNTSPTLRLIGNLSYAVAPLVPLIVMNNSPHFIFNQVI